MERRIGFYQVAASGLDGDGSCLSRDLEFNGNRDRNRRARLHILSVWAESLRLDRQVIWVKRNVGKLESSGTVGRGRAIKPADRVANLHGCFRDYRPGGVKYSSIHGTGIPHRLSIG